MATSRNRRRRLADACTFHGFRPQATVGLHDQEYLRLKILTCMLPILQNDQKSPTRLREDRQISSTRPTL
jgi:hypothetical protein